MSSEGLIGWVNRNIAEDRYGFRIDYSLGANSEYILIKNVKQGKIKYLVGDQLQDASESLDAGSDDMEPAAPAFLRSLDQIIGVNDLRSGDGSKIKSGALLECLARADDNVPVTIEYKRIEAEGNFEVYSVQVDSGEKPFYSPIALKAISMLPIDDAKAARTKGMVMIVLLFLLLTIIRCVAKFFQGYMAQKVVLVSVNRLRADAYDHILHMPVGYFAEERPTDAVSRLVNDTNVMGKGIKIILGKALREPLNALFLLGGAMWLNWQLATIFLCGAPAILGLLAVFGRRMKKATRKSLMASSSMLSKLQAAMAGFKVVKVYNQQKYEADQFENVNNRLLKQQLKIAKVDTATNPTMEVLAMTGGSAALIVGAYWVTSQKMEPESFLVFLGLLGAAAESIRKTSDIWNKLQQAGGAAERVFSLMDSPLEPQETDAGVLSKLENQIEFRDVVFTYPGSQEATLKGINLAVKAGQNIAIVGANGSGKTTLINLLPRFYDVDSGSIVIDGTDIRDVSLVSLRDQFGMVTQNVVTFNDTISANIRYGKVEATDEEVIEAAKRAYAHEFIETFPDGYATVIGEQGMGLSGGQLQRVVIARAILRNPSILIFDEAMSQVDANSEAKIHSAIEEIMRDRTSFIIAHRFSTVISADVIVVVDDGRIIAQGRHKELIKDCPLYQSLYETQLIAS